MKIIQTVSNKCVKRVVLSLIEGKNIKWTSKGEKCRIIAIEVAAWFSGQSWGFECEDPVSNSRLKLLE